MHFWRGGGVCAGPWRRLFLAQAAVALLFAACAVWFLGHCYAPVITEEIQKMPKAPSLTGGRLAGIPGVQVSETKFLSIAITADEDAELDQSADLQIALRRDHVDISSILSSALGSLEFGYGEAVRPGFKPDPSGAVVGRLAAGCFGRGGSGGGGLADGWSGPCWRGFTRPAAKLAAWFFDRQLSWPGAWRLACAALLPGAVLLALGLVLYGLQMVDVFGLGYFATVHFLVGWVYLLAAPVFAPRLSSARHKSQPISILILAQTRRFSGPSAGMGIFHGGMLVA